MSLGSVLSHWIKGDYAFGQTYAGRRKKSESSKYQEYLNYSTGWSPEDGLPYAPDPNSMGSGEYHDAYNRYNALVDAYNRHQDDVKWNREVEENWKMVHHEEDYNSIANQIKQFEENGLSKNLIYGSGNGGFIASSGGQVPSMGDYESQAQDPEQRINKGLSLETLMQLAGFAQSVYSGKLQNDATSANIERTKLGNDLLEIQKRILGAQADDLEDYYNYQRSWRDKNLQTMGSNLEVIKQNLAKLKSEAEVREFLKPYGLSADDPAVARLIALVHGKPEFRAMALETLSLLAGLAFKGPQSIISGIAGAAVAPFNNLIEDWKGRGLIMPMDTQSFHGSSYYGKNY